MNTSFQEKQNSFEINSVYQFKKILVAIDNLSLTEEVFQKGISIAQQYRSELMIFHCIQQYILAIPEFIKRPSIGVYSGVYSTEIIYSSEKLIKEVKNDINKWLYSLAQKALAKNISTQFEYSMGNPNKQICNKAHNWNADLIIMGRRGHKGISELFLGSVSNYVLHHAKCPVLIVQH